MGRAESVHMAFFPEPGELTAGIDEAVRKRTADWDRLMEVRGDVLKSLETARNEKLIGAPLEARVRLSANGDLYPLLEQYAPQLPGLFIVSQVDLERGGGWRRSRRESGTRRRAEVRTVLEVHDRRGFGREVPHDLRLVRRRDRRDFEWLISGSRPMAARRWCSRWTG